MKPSTYSTGMRAEQAGASLLEVLIAVLILAIGMLGIAALQAMTLKNTRGAAERTTAVIQSYAMMDMLRANRGAAVAGNYNQGYLCEAPEDPAASQIAGDMDRWIAQLQQSMGPTACGRITCGAQTCTIGIRWNDERASGGEAIQELTTVTRL
ncbi:type IV pilus modification protein PilV [Arenimonas daejeonensis]|uniref:type IV pilus modification protein PilV n=1 Tax=Arenimonas daejeonensis TaxID=370777 RepID=UPI001D14BC33|nr:type IV pilus modification protein PilV [Arenimonas daejeonensis]